LRVDCAIGGIMRSIDMEIELAVYEDVVPEIAYYTWYYAAASRRNDDDQLSGLQRLEDIILDELTVMFKRYRWC